VSLLKPYIGASSAVFRWTLSAGLPWIPRGANDPSNKSSEDDPNVTVRRTVVPPLSGSRTLRMSERRVLRRAAFVAVVQTTEMGNRHEVATGRRRSRSRDGSIVVQ
jgi:hypothetical protein